MGKKWGRVTPGSLRWKQRYDRLRREGFVHEEAAKLAEGIIGSKNMREGRKRRIVWMQQADRLSMTKKQLEAAVDDMYDTYDWYDPYSQFYSEGSGA